MTENKMPSTENWDDLMDTYLKAEHFKAFPGKAFVKNATAGISPKNKPQLILDVQVDGGKYKFDVNVTNMRKLKALGVSAPNKLINHNLILEKIRVQNPSTGKAVDSLEVIKIE